MRGSIAKRSARFSLSAHRMGGEGRGEVGSLPKLLRLAFACSVYFAVVSPVWPSEFSVLKPATFSHHVERFNAMDSETITNFIPNTKSWSWMKDNIPLFECPDAEVEEIYYFRWWSYRKHLVKTPAGFVITEFLPPVKHAGAYNTISCAAGFHLAEGRWLHDARFVDDYTRFWLRGNDGKPQPHFHKFSSWFTAAAYDRYLVTGDKKFLVNLLDDFVADYRAWEKEHQSTNGLFWQYDVADAMEESISGSRTNRNLRPTINTYMFANARAIAAAARLANKPGLVASFDAKAADLKRLTQEVLWDNEAKFFKVRLDGGKLSGAREAIGFIPWMFGLPDTNRDYTAAWSQFADEQGFRAPFGITTAERRHPQFRSHGTGTCEWDGAVWPFATSQTLTALANALRSASLSPSEGERAGVRGFPLSTQDYFSAFLTYTHSQHANGQPYIGEYLDEVTGDWINRNGRSTNYNHSTFADLLLTGVIGLRPRADDTVEIFPLLPPNTWNWFALDGVKYHGHMLTVIWDKDGTRYGRGAGLRVLADGKPIAQSASLERITGKLP